MTFHVKESNGVRTITPNGHTHSGTVIGNRNNNSIEYNDAVNSIVKKVVADKSKNIAFNSAVKYNREHGLPEYDSTVHNTPSTLGKQGAIGRVYEEAVKATPEYKQIVFDLYKRHYPELIKEHGVKDYDDLLHKSYSALAIETRNQFKAMPVRMQFHSGDLGYSSSNEMMKDIHHHHNLTVYRGGDRHEFLHHVDPETGLNENEMFRAVHDYYGHGIHGNQFGAKGEEVAWECHSKMFSPLARLAMTSETRGQNSYVNYTRANSDRYVKMEHHRKLANEAFNRGNIDEYNLHKSKVEELGRDWKYADQKAVLLPPSMTRIDYNGKMPKAISNLIGNNGTYDVDKDHLRLVQLAKSHNTTSQLSGRGGIYDRVNAVNDFNALLSHNGYNKVNKTPNL